MFKSVECDFVFMVLIVLYGFWSCIYYMLVWLNIWKLDLLLYLFYNENGVWYYLWLWLIVLLVIGIFLFMLSSLFIKIVFEIKLLFFIFLYIGF